MRGGGRALFVPNPGPCRSNLGRNRIHATSRPKRTRHVSIRPPRSVVRADLGHDRSYQRTSEEDRLSRIAELEEALDEAVAAEEYRNAAGLRDELQSAKNEDCVLLLAANLNYYDAFNSHSLERIGKLWDQSPSVVCQHPLSECHVGYENVVNSFAVLFSTLPADLRIDVSDVRIASLGAMAYVTCTETPQSELMTLGPEGKPRRHGLLATSVFEKKPVGEEGKFEYRMVHHVSTPIVYGVKAM